MPELGAHGTLHQINSFDVCEGSFAIDAAVLPTTWGPFRSESDRSAALSQNDTIGHVWTARVCKENHHVVLPVVVAMCSSSPNLETSMSKVLYERDGRIARITLNRPDVLNAIDDEVPQEIAAAVERADRDPHVHVIVLAGAAARFAPVTI
jgi:hypothetical protein